MGHAARRMNITLPADTASEMEIDLCFREGEYFLQARHNISLPGLEYEVAQAIVHAAHHTCPYSKATGGNISFEINLL